MPISCHFRDCKALLVTSLTRVRGAIASIADLYDYLLLLLLLLFFAFVVRCWRINAITSIHIDSGAWGVYGTALSSVTYSQADREGKGMDYRTAVYSIIGWLTEGPPSRARGQVSGYPAPAAVCPSVCPAWRGELASASPPDKNSRLTTFLPRRSVTHKCSHLGSPSTPTGTPTERVTVPVKSRLVQRHKQEPICR